MKKTILSLLLCLGVYAVQAQSDNFTLSGEIKGDIPPYLYFRHFAADGVSKLDSVQVVGDKFSYVGKLDEPKMVLVSTQKETRRMDDPNAMTLFLEPTVMHLQLETGNFKDLQLEGSKTQDEQKVLTLQKQPIQEKLKPYLDEYNKANEAYIDAMNAKKPEAEQEALKEKASATREKLMPFYKQMGDIDDAFIHSHPDSYLTAYMLRYKVSSIPLDSAETIYGRLTPRVQQSSWGKEIRKSIDQLIGGSPGSIASTFATKDINGNILKLEDFKGKYVLLDFWASWCVPCRKGNPHLLELYGLYQDKGLEIIGVSDDDSNHDAWRKAVEKDGIGVWKHVLRGLKKTDKGYDKSEDISEPYGIHTLPTKILIDPQGKIIGRYGGGGEDDAAMDKKLKEIFM